MTAPAPSRNGAATDYIQDYTARGWVLTPVYIPDPASRTCSCGKAACKSPGKHPVGDNWQAGTADPDRFRRRNIGVITGRRSGNLADVDKDCREAVLAAPYLLPPTDSAFGRGETATHDLFAVTDGEVGYLNLEDPLLTGSEATIIELRWSGLDEETGEEKAHQTVLPPSLHHSGERLAWVRDGDPAAILGADLTAAVRHIGAGVLIARYAKPKERHALLLLLGNLAARAGWDKDGAVRFMTAVFAAKQDAEMVARILDGEGERAAVDAGKRFKAGRHMMGLPALKEMLDPALSEADTGRVVARVKEWLCLPDALGPRITFGAKGRSSESSGVGTMRPDRYVPIPPYVPFPTECLPAPWNEFVRQGARALRCDEALVALPVLSVLAAAIGNTRRVHLGAEWYEPAVLWTCVVAESGGRKSPAADLSVDLVKTRQKRLVKEFKDQVADYKRELAEYKRREEGDGDRRDEPEKPVLKRVLVSDVTIEKLAGLLDDNRRGLLVYRDESAGWLGSFTRYKGKSGGSDEPNWLSMHRADAIIYDRKTGEKTSVFVPHAAGSVAGGIQPGTLVRLASQNLFDSGLVARIIFAMPPRTPKTWTDDEIDPDVKEAAADALDALFNLAGEVDDDGEPRPVVVRLAQDARTRLKRFVNEWGVRQFDAEGERAAVLAKLEALPGRFALIHHCVVRAAAMEDTDPIGLESLEAGMRVAEWCATEADRVYRMLGESAEEKDIRKLVEAVSRLADRNGGRITVKALQNTNSRKYRTADDAKAALERLVGHGLGRWEDGPEPEGGGKRQRFFVPISPSVDGEENPEDHPVPTTDDSDDRSPGGGEADDDEGTGLSDDRLDPPDDRPPTGTAESPQQSGPPGTCDDSSKEGPERSSESSVVGHDREAENLGSGTDGDRESVVEQAWKSVAGQVTPIVVTDRAGLGAVIDALRPGESVGLDTETTGLCHARDSVRLLSLATPQGTFLVDLFRVDPAPLWASLASVELVGHNLGFDLPFLMRLGFTPGRLADTMLASQILGAGDITTRHTLKDIAARHLDRTLDKELQNADWTRPLTPEMLRYAADDAELPRLIWEKLTAEITAANLTETLTTELNALPCVAWTSLHGVGLDRTAWESLAVDSTAEAERLGDELDAIAPNSATLTSTTNWNSPEQVRHAFCSVGIQVDSTDDDALAAIDHHLAAALREYRSASKLAGTYGRDWLKHSGPDDRVFATWKQIGAGASGRMSCKGPNLQNLPRDPRYRRCFVAPGGRTLVKADYSQIELRIAAKITGDTRMLDAYRKSDDLHTLTARALLGKAEITKSDRQLAKAVNFGLLYGQSAEGLLRYAAANYGVKLTSAEAARHRETFFRTYSGLRAWHRSIANDPCDTRTLTGRRRRDVRRFTEKLNTPVQGSGADGLKRALALLWERRTDCPGAFPVLLVHDEIVVECDAGRAEETADWVREAMRDGMAPLIDPVPVEVEVTTGRTWAG